MKIKCHLTLLTIVLLTINSYSQNYTSNLIIEGNKNLVLSTNTIQGQGKLSTGETVKSSCDHGACYFKIDYNGRNVGETLGENYSSLKIYEYDLGGDGDKELIVSFDQQKINKKGDYSGATTMLYIYRYSKGLLQKIFSKEIMMYKTIIKKNYIEYYMPSGLDAIWNYYHGAIYEMKSIQVKN